MSTESLDTDKIFSATSDTVSELANLMSAVDEERVNSVPY
jgi:hypothetical protein